MFIKADSVNDTSMNIEIGLVKNRPFGADVEKMVLLITAFAKTALDKIKSSSNSFDYEKKLTENDILNIVATRLFQNSLSEEDFMKLISVLNTIYKKQDTILH